MKYNILEQPKAFLRFFFLAVLYGFGFDELRRAAYVLQGVPLPSAYSLSTFLYALIGGMIAFALATYTYEETYHAS